MTALDELRHKASEHGVSAVQITPEHGAIFNVFPYRWSSVVRGGREGAYKTEGEALLAGIGRAATTHEG